MRIIAVPLALVLFLASAGCDKVKEKAKGQSVYLIVFRYGTTNGVNSALSEKLIKCETLTPEVIVAAKQYLGGQLSREWDTNTITVISCTKLYQ